LLVADADPGSRTARSVQVEQALRGDAADFIPAPHIPADALLASSRARRESLAQIAGSGIETDHAERQRQSTASRC